MEVEIVVLSDTQRTLGIERWILRKKQYDLVRDLIAESISMRRPDLLILNGDLTAIGSSTWHWDHWLKWMNPILSSGIPVLPMMGNHDYIFNRKAAIRNFEKIFPAFRPPIWRIEVVNRVAILVLDSNRWAMRGHQWREQVRWFSETLHDLEATPEIFEATIISHHPISACREFATSFFESKKARTWISGHFHTFREEHLDQKRLITFGGGGGPPLGAPQFGYLVGKVGPTGVRWRPEFVSHRRNDI